MTTTDASGVHSLGWLLIAAPLFGAMVLLLGGRRTDKWGHLLGVAMPALAFLVARGDIRRVPGAITPSSGEVVRTGEDETP